MLMGLEYLAARLEEHPDKQVVGVLGDMKQAIARADSIVRGLLNFASQRDLDLRPTDVNELVESSLALVKHELDRSHAQVIRNLGPSLPKLMADRSRLEQVLVNIHMNAAQAMPNGGTLTVQTARRPCQGRRNEYQTVVVVEDTGTGIPEPLVAKIYEPFFTTKPTGQGTGLGLTVSRKIIELHKGEIQIQNRPEGGVRVTLVFKDSGPSKEVLSHAD
jgi:signal transduction histidine kinase